MEKSIVKLPHHEQQKLCHKRPVYRQGRKFTAVKVYTINDESQHLIVCGVPKLNLSEELKSKFTPYGDLRDFHSIEGYVYEDFTEAFHVHYQRIQSARVAKRFLDGFNFYGGSLHVFYAPELESLSETRKKLNQRRKDITTRIKIHREDPTNPELVQCALDDLGDAEKK